MRARRYHAGGNIGSYGRQTAFGNKHVTNGTAWRHETAFINMGNGTAWRISMVFEAFGNLCPFATVLIKTRAASVFELALVDPFATKLNH